jgi:hypothetical protein
MPLKRQIDWAASAYHDFLLSRAQAPFEWGENDCALFAADGIKAMTGVDIAEEFRGKYADKAGAMDLIETVCKGTTVADWAAYCAEKHGLEEWADKSGKPSPLFAQRGDLVVFSGATGETVAGLVHLSGAHIVAIGEKGLYRFPISKVLRAWHV